jgi:hypothetical protein
MVRVPPRGNADENPGVLVKSPAALVALEFKKFIASFIRPA